MKVIYRIFKELNLFNDLKDISYINESKSLSYKLVLDLYRGNIDKMSSITLTIIIGDSYGKTNDRYFYILDHDNLIAKINTFSRYSIEKVYYIYFFNQIYILNTCIMRRHHYVLSSYMKKVITILNDIYK